MSAIPGCAGTWQYICLETEAVKSLHETYTYPMSYTVRLPHHLYSHCSGLRVTSPSGYDVYITLPDDGTNYLKDDIIRVELTSPTSGYAFRHIFEEVEITNEEALAAAQGVMAELRDVSSQLFKGFCVLVNVHPDSEWAKLAANSLLNSLSSRYTESMRGSRADKPLHVKDVKMGDEIARLFECYKIGADPVTTSWSCINEFKEVSAQMMADELVQEEEAEKAKKLCESTSTSKRAAKKKHRKQKAKAKLQSISENEFVEDEVAHVYQTVEEQSRDFVDHAAVDDQLVLEDNEQARDFVDLSDLKTSLFDKSDDAATSVATSLQCVVCMRNERAVAAVPCGHKCLCEECGKTSVLQDLKCPMCRAEIKMFIRIWD